MNLPWHQRQGERTRVIGMWEGVVQGELSSTGERRTKTHRKRLGKDIATSTEVKVPEARQSSSLRRKRRDIGTGGWNQVISTTGEGARVRLRNRAEGNAKR